MTHKRILGTIFVAAFVASAAPSQTVFRENCEGTLAEWTGKSFGIHHAQHVPDPIERDNCMSFSKLDGCGNVFTRTKFAAGAYTLTFDYLGYKAPGSVPGNFGGFLGITDSTVGCTSRTTWLFGTSPYYASIDLLVDDGRWHRYSVQFESAVDFHLTLQDFSRPGGVPGDALFDNLQLSKTSTGPGCPGKGGAVPALSVTGYPTPGRRVQLELTDGLPRAPALLLIGPIAGSVRLPNSCVLRVAPVLVSAAMTLDSNGRYSLQIGIPRGTPSGCVHTQIAVIDAGAHHGYSASNGIKTTITQF